MSNTTTDPNMGFQNPVPGTDPGPDYATNVSNSLRTIGAHNHSAGNGVKVTPSGLLINIDLPFDSNNATGLRSVRFTPQTGALSGVNDLGCLYEAVVDLWFNDGNGNQIRITESGGVAGSPGSISNLTSPASAAYVSGTQTFVWQSGVNTPANMDAGSYIFRNISPGSNGVTVSAPASLAADYPLVWPPALPSGNAFLLLDNSGNMSDSQVYPLTTSGIATAAVTLPTMAAPNMVISSSSGTYSATGTGSYVAVTNLNVSITTTGKPVSITFQADGASVGGTNPSYIDLPGGIIQAIIVKDGTLTPASYQLQQSGASGSLDIKLSPGLLNYIDPAPSAGTHTYELRINGTISVFYTVMVVREL